MFKVVLNDGQNELPEDDIYYVIAKEGIYLKKKLGIMESLAPVKNISILNSVQSTAKMHIKPIPGKWIAKVIEFFKEVYKEHRSEAIVLLFYNEEKGIHKIVPPTQKVAGASCDYDKGLTIEGYTMIGTIHSHGSMSAFHSGVDDKDEEHFDGLHITIGDLDEEYPSISASIVANGFRVVVEPTEYISNLALMSEINQVEDKPIRRVYRLVDGKLVEDKEAATPTYTYRKYDRRYGVLVSPRDKIFNKKWMKMVEKGTYTYKSYRPQEGWYGYGAHGYQMYHGHHGYPGFHNGWGHNYDPNVWKEARGVQPPAANAVKPTEKAESPLNVGPTQKPLVFPPHTPEGEFIPCATCVHRLCKLTSEIEEEDYEDEIYECTQCGELVKEIDTDVLECSQCKTDAHLVLITESNLMNSYVPSDEFDHLFEKDRESKPSAYIKCKTCGNGFHLFEGDELCPFCYTPIKEYSSEDSLEKQAKMDSGGFLTPEQEELNDAILKAAREADENLERIPEPGSNAIPLSRKKDGLLKTMFQKVFSKERYNND